MAERTGPSDAIRAAIDEVLSDLADDGRPPKHDLAVRIAALVADRIAEERKRCAGLCRARGELWVRTEATSSATPLQTEARARSNEARYLADLLESGEDVPLAG
ncbi:MAG TPA: hypothetical protein VMS56_13060 [Thermoanaerobaculia bacterium]|nr:hypothetical protein [Thermoanaerobaculia bacterium]